MNLKNKEGITSHLQRIFFYGDDLTEPIRVNSFLNFLSSNTNPFTNKPYELCARSLYRYISGAMHFPVDLLPALVSWSLDVALMDAYGIYPAPDDAALMREKIAAEREAMQSHADRIALMEKRLARPKTTMAKEGTKCRRCAER